MQGLTSAISLLCLLYKYMGKRYDALNLSNNTYTLQPCLPPLDEISSDPNEQGYG